MFGRESSHSTSHEKPPLIHLPLVTAAESYAIDDDPTISHNPPVPDGTVFYYPITYPFAPIPRRNFCLYTTIGKYRFGFYLNQSNITHSYYEFSSETIEYGFAVVNLSQLERDTLFLYRASFVETVAQHEPEMETINIFTVDSAYTPSQIEMCLEALKTHVSMEDLNEMRQEPSVIFSKYKKIFGSDFRSPHDSAKNHSMARKRLFMHQFKKYLRTFTVVDGPDNRFTLQKLPD